MNKWVVDSSVLIFLAKASHLFLLQELCDQIIIPEGVAEEIQKGPEDDPARNRISTEGKPFVQFVGEINHRVVLWDIGKGESEVLTWALQNPGHVAILDDEIGRNCALALGVPVKGTLGVLLIAKKRGIIREARPILEKLVEIGYRITPKLLEDNLKLVGE